MSAHWDKLAVSKPVNATAGRVTAGSSGLMPVGPKQVESRQHWETAPATIPVPENAPQLVGAQKGRLTVVGYLGKGSGKDAKGRWLARCACGHFESRTSKALQNPANNEDCCVNCRHTAYLKRAFTSATHRTDGSRARQSA